MSRRVEAAEGDAMGVCYRRVIQSRAELLTDETPRSYPGRRTQVSHRPHD